LIIWFGFVAGLIAKPDFNLTPQKSPNTEFSAEALLYMMGPQRLELQTKGL